MKNQPIDNIQYLWLPIDSRFARIVYWMNRLVSTILNFLYGECLCYHHLQHNYWPFVNNRCQHCCSYRTDVHHQDCEYCSVNFHQDNDNDIEVYYHQVNHNDIEEYYHQDYYNDIEEYSSDESVSLHSDDTWSTDSEVNLWATDSGLEEDVTIPHEPWIP